MNLTTEDEISFEPPPAKRLRNDATILHPTLSLMSSLEYVSLPIETPTEVGAHAPDNAAAEPSKGALPGNAKYFLRGANDGTRSRSGRSSAGSTTLALFGLAGLCAAAAEAGTVTSEPTAGATSASATTTSAALLNTVQASRTCLQCNQVFRAPYSLRRHVESVHLGLKPHKCSMCSAAFAAPDKLKTHLQHVHMRPKAKASTIVSFS